MFKLHVKTPSFAKKIGPILHLIQYSIITPPIMSTHTHLFSTRMPHVPIELEIVEDSEPERIEIQKSLKKRPRTSTENLQSSKTIIHNTFKNHADWIPVIEISDSDSQPSISPSKYTRKRDIADARTQVQVQPTATNSDDRILYGKPSSASTSHTPPTSMYKQIPCQRQTSEDQPFKGSKLNLDHFLLQSSRTPRNIQVSIEPVPTISSALPNGNTKGSKQKRLHHNLSAIDVAKITRCVCCNVQWTARKSGAQKMTHIQSCAKKHALDDGTVNFLIQKEVSPQEPVVKQTFFEDVLGDAAPKQKVKRRKKGESSLKTISVSRDSILAQAQGILSTSIDGCNYKNGGTFAGSTQGHSQLPSTQAFGHSDLGRAQSLECNTFSLDDHCHDISDDSDQGAPEAQSAFLASCLAPRPLKVFGDHESDRKGTQSAVHSSGDESGVESNDINPKRLSPSSIEGTRIPGTPSLDLLSALTNLTIHSPTKKARKAKNCLDVSSHSDEHDEHCLSSDRVSPKKKLGPSKKTSSKIAHQFDEEWRLHMMRNIMLNDDLHLRILRYEPIHFDVFLEIAIRYAPPSGKLKRHLRTYLDDQAIIFYGEATTRR